MTPRDPWDETTNAAPASDVDAGGHDEDLSRLVEDLRRLPRSLEPPRDLWPAIAARLDRDVSAPRPRRAGWLAAALVAASTAAFVAGRWSGGDAPPVAIGAEEAPPPARPAVTVPPNLAAASASLERTRRELERAFEERRADLPPAALAVVDQNLAAIAAAIAEIEEALDVHPSDPQLGRRLVAYKTREIALLEQAQRAAARL